MRASSRQTVWRRNFRRRVTLPMMQRGFEHMPTALRSVFKDRAKFLFDTLYDEIADGVLFAEVVDGLVVAVADLDEVAGQLARDRMAVLDVIAEIAAVPAEGADVFVERGEQLEDFHELLFRKLLVVGEVVEADVFAAQLDEYFAEFGVVVHVFDTLFSGDLVKRRLGDIDVTTLNELGHLPVEECQ